MSRPHLLGCLVVLSTVSTAATAAVPVDFQRDVQPIFRRHCYRCHGERKSEGGLRLSSRQAAFGESDSGEPPIRPGDPAGSMLLLRLTDADYGDIMPLDGEPLGKDQIALIRRWVEQGATWPDSAAEDRHWAYVKPTRPTPPAVKQTDWPQSPIDRFILARLEREGIAPAPPADPAKQLRRASLALVGLPPSPAEVEAFVNDPSPEAYARHVDRLLRSERFGERWAQRWLDLARYADSNGFQADQLRASWAYRDWVIRAFNENKPFDEFVVEQIAGDLIPGASLDQKIATGFHRATTCNVEAGVQPEENRTNQVIDRVNTTGLVFLGTTLECCQCHDHKYDPFTQRDYYRLFAYFNNTPLEVELDSGVQFDFVGPTMDLPLPPDMDAQRQQLQSRLTAIEPERQKLREQRLAGFAAWEQKITASLKDNPPRWQVLPVAEFTTTGGEEHRLLEDGSILLGGQVPDTTTYTLRIQNVPPGVMGLKVEALTDDSLPGQGPGRGDKRRPNFILSELTARVVGNGKGKPRPVSLRDAEADYSQARYEVAKAIDGNPKTGWAIGQQFAKPHWATFRCTEPVALTAGESLVVALDQQYGQGRTIGRVRVSALLGDPLTAALPEDVRKILLKEKRTKKDEDQLRNHYADSDPAVAKLNREVAGIEKQLKDIAPPTTLVMVEMDEPRQTHILARGDYLNPGEAVPPGTPASLHPLDAALPPDRLGLATWLVSPENPLLARVTVNRWWAALFGQGLVTTPEDFGTQAEPPTHPELLDWLAVELVESGWDMKHVLRLMVTSAAFRQESGKPVESGKRKAESGNSAPDSASPLSAFRFPLYSAGPRFRLPAEAVRDNALAIAGLLSAQMYGPPIMPFQPEGVWKAVGRNAPKWQTATDEERFRRGVYVVWRRAAPYPSFVTFDAPDRAACVVQRPRTNTPLQALTLLNDPVYAEAALALAQRMMQEAPSGTPESRAAYGMTLCIARPPRDEEVAVLVRLYQAERKKLVQQPKLVDERLKNLLPRLRDESLDPTELTAWFAVANVLLNLDETITVN